MKNGRVDILTFTQTLTTPYTVNTCSQIVQLLCVGLFSKSKFFFFFWFASRLVFIMSLLVESSHRFIRCWITRYGIWNAMRCKNHISVYIFSQLHSWRACYSLRTRHDSPKWIECIGLGTFHSSFDLIPLTWLDHLKQRAQSNYNFAIFFPNSLWKN